jgi:acetate kinase
MSVILTCNAGSHNTKLAAFDAETLERREHAVTRNTVETNEWIESISTYGIVGIGHRVVHGGRDFIQPTVITSDVIDRLQTFIALAPLHQPAALALIENTLQLYPKVPQIACFDTAFHHTMPDIERRLPLPRSYFDEGMMRYGFHGLSYQYIAAQLPEYACDRVIVAHLGGGASACAMKGKISIASTMGFSTLDGLMMGTRPGALDAGAVLHLLTEKKMTPEQVTDLLYHHAGLKGVSGMCGDMRELVASPKPEARDAVELYCYLAARQIAGLVPALGGLDALVFTGGIGENQVEIQEKIISYLRWIGDFNVHVIPTNEEAVIAESCRSLMKGQFDGFQSSIPTAL